MTASPSSISFGPLAVGTAQTKVATISNSGTTALTVTQISVSGTGFSTSGVTLPLKLNAGQSVPVNITFVPQGTSGVAGSMAVVATASSRGGKGSRSSSSLTSASVALTGTASTQGQLSFSPQSLSFGGVQVGSAQTLSAQVSNTGGTPVTISQAVVSGSDYSVQGLNLPLSLAAGQSATLSVRFAPQAAAAASGSVTLLSDAANGSMSLPLTGTGLAPGALSASPSSLSFGNVQLSTAKKLSTLITNTGGSSVTVSQVTTSGSGITFSGLSLPLTLAAGQTATGVVTFAPTSAGAVSGSVTISSNGSNPTLNIPVSGAGVTAGALAASPATLSFGNVQAGTSASLSETLTNTGGITVNVSQATVTGNSYSVTGLTIPASIAPGQSVSFTVKYAPTVSGYTNGSLSIVSDASNSTLSIPLSGTGVSAGLLAVSPTGVSFGNVSVGSSAKASVTLSNSGGSTVTVSQLTTTGTGFSFSGISLPLTLASGQSVSFTLTFVPQATGAVNGDVSVLSDASNAMVKIPLSGSGVQAGTLTASPTAMDFGDVAVGSSKSQNGILTNAGGSSLTLSTVKTTGYGYNVSGPALPLTLSAGQSATFTVSFSPTSSGTSSGSLAVTTDISSLTVPLSGSGSAQGQLAINPTSLSFGSTVVGLTSTKSATLSATSASVTVSSGNITSSEFTISGLTFPFTIAAGASKTFSVNFTPNATGTGTATLSFASNATNTLLAMSLSGTGAAPPPHSVTLSWNASTSVVAGYNVYRGSVSGGPYTKVGSTTNGTPTYVDDTVVAGSSYYYVITAVTSTGTESTYSNQVQALIPAP